MKFPNLLSIFSSFQGGMEWGKKKKKSEELDKKQYFKNVSAKKKESRSEM